MRNLKRALSLALASVMLLGMMVVGSSAAFADADQIVNTEAVEITAGLGLFAGSDGKFNPTGTVTRAQMATVIAKMLYGSEINADQFKGTGKFSDTVAFEGGWAEGYISLCANLGIVGGYGDGTFKPGQAVTTAEAVTMIINALGVDAGEGTWPLTVMAKAEEMDLFDELEVKPGTNVALTRDQLASIVLEGIKYSPKGVTGYTIPGSSIVFEELGDAVIANGSKATGIKEVVGEDALYRSVFGVQSMSGFVYANQATDKGAEYTIIGNKAFNIETDTDLIGHYVTVYFKDEYKSESEPGKTYCIVDESTIVNVEKAILGKRAEFRAAFGTRNIEQAAYIDPVYGGLTYDVLVYDGTLNRTRDTNVNDSYTYNYNTFNASAGKYVIYDNTIIAFVAPLTVNATKVTKVTTTAGLETIAIPGTTWQNNATEDEVVEYDGIAKDDIITYTLTGNIYHLAKATTVEGQVSTVAQNSDNSRWGLTVNGTRYEYFGGAANSTALAAEGISLLTSKPVNFNFSQNYTLYLTESGKLIGYAAAEGASANISDVIYVTNVYTTQATNTYGVKTEYKYAQGVDMNGKEVNILIDVAPETAQNSNVFKTVLTGNAATLASAVTADKFYTFTKTTDSKGAKEGIMTGSVAPATHSPVALDPENDGVNNSAPVFHLAGVKFNDSKDRLGADTKYLKSTSGNAYVTAGTKFILVSGTGSQQESTITVGSINFNLTNATGIQLLLTQDTAGNKIAEAVVIKVANITIDSDPFYVSANQKSFVNHTADGYVFEVYNAKTGELATLTLASSSDLLVGFYNFDYDAEDKLHTLSTTNGGQADAGIIETNVTFQSYYNGMLTTSGGVIDNMSAKDAKVIDIRTQKQLDQSTIEQVTSIDDIVYLVAEEGKTITLDIIHDVKAENVIAIYVTSIS